MLKTCVFNFTTRCNPRFTYRYIIFSLKVPFPYGGGAFLPTYLMEITMWLIEALFYILLGYGAMLGCAFAFKSLFGSSEKPDIMKVYKEKRDEYYKNGGE
jgi:hypothetical protein